MHAGDGEVQVRGSDVRDVARMIHSNNSCKFLSIEPIIHDMHSDSPYQVGFKAPPTERFLVCWSFGDENFQRKVTGIRELNAVLQPIFLECKKALKARERQRAALKREYERKEEKDRIVKDAELLKYAKDLERQAKAIREEVEERGG